MTAEFVYLYEKNSKNNQAARSLEVETDDGESDSNQDVNAGAEQPECRPFRSGVHHRVSPDIGIDGESLIGPYDMAIEFEILEPRENEAWKIRDEGEEFGVKALRTIQNTVCDDKHSQFVQENSSLGITRQEEQHAH